MRDHDEVIKYVLQRAEEIKREEENGTVGGKEKVSAQKTNVFSGKLFHRAMVVASCGVLIGLAFFAASKLGGGKKPGDKPAGTVTTPPVATTIVDKPVETTTTPSATPTIGEEPPHGGKEMGTWYLTCENEMEREYNHGDIIEKKYKIVSTLEMTGCEIVVTKSDGVEVVSTDTAAGNGEPWTYVWNVTIRVRVNDAVDPGSVEFSMVPTFVDQEQAEQEGMKELKQTMYASNIGQKDYVCLNYVDGLYGYSEKVRQYIDDLNRQGESVEYPLEELAVGFDDDENGKPMMPQRIAYRCPTFVQKGERLIVDVYVGDYSYEYHQRCGGEPSYDTYGENGYPNLQVYSSALNDFQYSVLYDDKLLINGTLNKYSRIFTLEEMPSMELGLYDSISRGRHERVEIDFSNYEVGNMGEIVLSFSWDFGEPPSEGTWLGSRTSISFYVGENGVSTGGSWEYAVENYEKYR